MASKSLQRALGAIVLAFESFIVFFGTLVSWTRSCGLYRYNREQDVFRLAEVGGDD